MNRRFWFWLTLLMLWLWAGCRYRVFAQTETVSGSMFLPNGTPFTGTVLIGLAKSSVVDTCVTPAVVVPFPGLTVHVTGGVFPSTSLLPTTCLTPRLPYTVAVNDSLNRTVYTDNWYIPSFESSTVNIGDLGSVKLAAGITVSVPLAIVSTPSGNQTVTQPTGTSLSVNNITVTSSLSVTGALSASSFTSGTIDATTSVTTPLLTGNTVNASTYEVGGVALSAANLSNGVSGTGAVCLASGSSCAGGVLYYQTVSEAGTSLTQRSTLNFDGTVLATDSTSPARTNVGLPAVGSAGTYGVPVSITTDAQGRVSSITAVAPSQIVYWSNQTQLISGRAFSAIYTNSSTVVLDALVTTSCSNSCSIAAYTGASGSLIPVGIQAFTYNGGGGQASIDLKVLPGNSYEFIASGASIGVDAWMETLQP